MVEKSIPKALEKIAEDICENYCKYAERIREENGNGKEHEKLIQEHCLKCPTMQLMF